MKQGLIGFFLLAAASPLSAGPPAKDTLRSARNGPWSAPATWEGGKVPGAMARVQIRPGHLVTYDVKEGPIIRFLHVGGTLEFARDRSTRLDVGLLKVQPGDDASEDGFECDAHFPEPDPDLPRAALLVGTPERPIPAEYSATIRLTYVPGTDKASWPALICCGGRMDIHGAPLSRTWVKLGTSVIAGQDAVFLEEEVTGWKVGDRLIVTASHGEKGNSGTRRPGVGKVPVQTEEAILKVSDGKRLLLDRPLKHDHRGEGPFRAAVANLSRNVVVESADPEGVRGHTMYHRGSAGSLSYAEFRHLGKEGVLGRYAIHFHLVGNTMRGSYVQGMSIWDSHNRWVTVHGTNFMVVRDCVGYRGVGHGFFLEDGMETYNLFDRNLAVQAFVGAKLPKQALPYDPNDGAGFWWGSSLNAFTRNSTCENDRYGYRFDATPTDSFKLRLPVLFPDGKRYPLDIRKLPFLRFEDNESACDGKYGLNLGEGVRRVGPEKAYPFILKNTKIWNVRLAFRPESPCVIVDGMHIHGAVYGVYHPNYDFHVYRNLTISDTVSEPFNRGHDDDSIQHGPLSVDGLFFEQVHGNNPIPLIQITDTNPSGSAETHLRNLKVGKSIDGHTRSWINLGGGNRPDPASDLCVPVYVHDYFGKGRHAKVISVKSRDLVSDGVPYKELPPLTGDASRVCEARNLEFPELLRPEDNLAPGTIITHVLPAGPGKLKVRGTTIDNGTVTRVTVNGREARAVDSNFLQWEVELTGLKTGPLEVVAQARDEAGNVEASGHCVTARVE